MPALFLSPCKTHPRRVALPNLGPFFGAEVRQLKPLALQSVA